MLEGRGGDVALTVERQAAARTLLVRPLIRADSEPDDFAATTTHSDWLIQRFDVLLGYSLTVEARFARLHKGAPTGLEPAGLIKRGGAPFTPRGYAYLTLALAVLSSPRDRVGLTELLADIRAAAAESGIRLGARGRLSERRPLAAALVQLVDWGVLTAAGVTPADFATLMERGPHPDHDIDLRVDQDILRAIPGLAALHDSVEFSGEPGQRERHVELAVRRRLVEQAVVYRDELSDAHRDWLAQNQWRTVAQLGSFLGCDGEIRAEGVALVGVSDGQESGFPAGQLDRPAVRLLSQIAGELRPHRTARATPVPDHLMDEAVAAIPDTGSRARALERLVEFGLIERSDPGQTPEWSLLAAAARFTPHDTDRDAT